MQWLSYADRELLLRTLDAVKEGRSDSDEHLLGASSEWAKSLTPKFGFEHALARDVTSLSRYLVTHQHDADIAGIARGGLLYVLQTTSNGDSRLGDFGLLDDAFVLSYAVHEIRTRLEEPATYNPPRLRPDEQRRAEDLFLEMLERPAGDDEVLLSNAERTLRSLGSLSASGLFRRLHNNVEFLSNILRDNERSEEHRNFARAALAYVAAQDDAIDDRLGIVGYLDDNFVAQMAVDLVEPHREPFLELLDAAVAAWPFLSGLVLDEDSQVRTLSEYNIINAALCCQELRAGSAYSQTVLVVPHSGPLPLLLGFLATLGLIQRSGQRHIDESSFHEGQSVIVDHCAVAEFAGFETFEGRRMFGLRQYYRHAGQELSRTRYWPISGLRRLVPSTSGRRPRGQLEFDLSRSDAALPGLEYLFNSSKIAELSTVDRQVIVVMPLVRAKEYSADIRLYGCPLKDIVPTGHLATAGNIERWSERFGQQEPVLLFASDIDVACAYAEGRTERIEVLIVDASSNRASRPATLRRLKQFEIPSLCVTIERFVDELGVGLSTSGLWEWSDGDIAALVWPAAAESHSSGVVADYEEQVRARSGSVMMIHRVSCAATEVAYNAVRQLAEIARLREDDQLPELDNAVTLAYRALSYLLRTAVRLTSDLESIKDVQEVITDLHRIAKTTRYMSQGETDATTNVATALESLFEVLKTENPKVAKLQEVLKSDPRLSIICPDARIRRDLQSDKQTSSAPLIDSVRNVGHEVVGAVAHGWFRKDRMKALLMPPMTSPFHLILYDLEAAWLHSLQYERRRSRSGRASSTRRSSLFPQVRGWGTASTPPVSSKLPEPDKGSTQLDSIEEYVLDAYRRHVQAAAAPTIADEPVDAHFAIFEGGAHAFLTEFYRANVVTHLIDAVSAQTDENPGVLQKAVGKLTPGDALLFNRGSQRDVIRIAADGILPEGCRETSALWRTALIQYVRNEDLSIEQIHEQLKTKGCSLQQNTIRLWFDNEEMIAPLAFQRDVPIIAEVTRDIELVRNLDGVLKSISAVRSAHLRASRLLASQIHARAIELLSDGWDSQSLVELESNVVIARLLSIDHDPTSVRKSMVNRLLEDERWLG